MFKLPSHSKSHIEYFNILQVFYAHGPFVLEKMGNNVKSPRKTNHK